MPVRRSRDSPRCIGGEPRYRVESEAHYEILDHIFYADTLEECEWAVSYVEKMLGDSAESLGLRVVRIEVTE